MPFGAIGSIISTAIGSRTARRNTDKTNRANRELAEYAYSKDLEMWQRQNEYNTPAAQMARFGEAGLNPNLIYGQGTPGNASQMPTYNAPRMDYNYKPAFDPGNALMEFQDFRQKNASVDLTKQQVLGQEIKNTIDKLGILPATVEERIYAAMYQTTETVRYGDGSMSRNTFIDSDKTRPMAEARYNQRMAEAALTSYVSEIKKWERNLSRQGMTPGDSVKVRMATAAIYLMGDFFGINVERYISQLQSKSTYKPGVY